MNEWFNCRNICSCVSERERQSMWVLLERLSVCVCICFALQSMYTCITLVYCSKRKRKTNVERERDAQRANERECHLSPAKQQQLHRRRHWHNSKNSKTTINTKATTQKKAHKRSGRIPSDRGPQSSGQPSSSYRTRTHSRSAAASVGKSTTSTSIFCCHVFLLWVIYFSSVCRLLLILIIVVAVLSVGLRMRKDFCVEITSTDIHTYLHIVSFSHLSDECKYVHTCICGVISVYPAGTREWVSYDV